ncbi:MAG: 16S rRNA (cytidine(1402)-2'-O)-methyltransferase, partial [Methylovirgula sp.]
IVLLVGPPSRDAPPIEAADLDRSICKAIESFSVKEAATVVSVETGQPRRKVYARAVELSARAR